MRHFSAKKSWYGITLYRDLFVWITSGRRFSDARIGESIGFKYSFGNFSGHLAATFGFPLVMKIESPDILHKSVVGGVKVNIKTPGEVEPVFAEIMDSAHKYCLGARINGNGKARGFNAGR